jgi:prolipoprotein diacylglyceryltransferase
VDPFPRHPAQVYEAIGYFTIAGILCLLEKKKFTEWKKGSILAVAIILSFTFRFFIEFVKDEQATISLTPSLNMGQLLSIAFVIGGIVLWLRVRKNPE